VILLEVPGSLSHRDVALRTVSAACKLLATNANGGPEKAWSEFRMHFVSAVSEAFNNIVIHSYRGQRLGTVRMDIELGQGVMTVRMADYGSSFDPTVVPSPDLDTLPESGLGLFIIRSFMDSVSYEPGRPNVLVLVKSVRTASQDGKVGTSVERR
jgi:serine/threonine-protein kinase RsbW